MKFKICIKRIISTILHLFVPVKDCRCRVLLYHSIDKPCQNDKLGLRISVQNFKSQIEYLIKNNYTILEMDELADRLSHNKVESKMIAITFDDGYKDILTNVFLILNELKIKFTIFVSPFFLDGNVDNAGYWSRWDHLDWKDIYCLKEKGVNIGCHSGNHKDLTLLTEMELYDEIGSSKEILEKRLGCVIKSFSYPYGKFNQKVKDVVGKSGYKYACCSIIGFNGLLSDRFELRRTEITKYDTMFDFKMKLEGSYDWLAWLNKFRG